jgi:hypothetical protein
MQVAPPEPEPPPPPPEPAHPVMHEYAWPGVANNAPAHFSIAAKTGPVREALAVWVQDGRVKYTAAGGSTGSLALAAVDCGTTDRLNTANHLKLSLPGCASPK